MQMLSILLKKWLYVENATVFELIAWRHPSEFDLHSLSLTAGTVIPDCFKWHSASLIAVLDLDWYVKWRHCSFIKSKILSFQHSGSPSSPLINFCSCCLPDSILMRRSSVVTRPDITVSINNIIVTKINITINFSVDLYFALGFILTVSSTLL